MRGGGSLEGGWGVLPRNFLKIYVSENAFQAILKPTFPYCITSILSKVRHSNPRGGGYSDILYTYVGSGYFGGFKNLNFDFWVVFRKMIFFWV